MLSLRQPESPFDPPSLLSVFLSSPVKFLLRALHSLFSFLRPRPKASSPPIRIVCISDTHCNTRSDIPDGDLLIHAGDLTNAGTPTELQAQIDWLSTLPHPYKIAISGNHDTYLDPRSRTTLPPSDANPSTPLNWHGIHYLQHTSVTLTFPSHRNRTLRIHGAPQIPACGGPEFAFQYPRGRDAWTDTVPAGTDVLVTHTPPKQHLDLPVALGCEFLLREVWRVRPRVHVFGHVHAGRGREVVYWDEAQRARERGLERPDGLLRGLLDVRLWAEVLRVAWFGLRGVLWARVWGGDERAGWMVNASLMLNNSGRLGNEAQVVEI